MAQVKRINQMEVNRIMDDGSVRRVVEVSFYVNDKGPFTQDVPKESYEPEVVASLVNDYAQRIERAEELLGS